jgi:hypothetical protein
MKFAHKFAQGLTGCVVCDGVRYIEQLRLLEGERLTLEASKEALNQKFRQYQGLKTQELQVTQGLRIFR